MSERHKVYLSEEALAFLSGQGPLEGETLSGRLNTAILRYKAVCQRLASDTQVLFPAGAQKLLVKATARWVPEPAHTDIAYLRLAWMEHARAQLSPVEFGQLQYRLMDLTGDHLVVLAEEIEKYRRAKAQGKPVCEEHPLFTPAHLMPQAA